MSSGEPCDRRVVALARCESYAFADVLDAVRRGLNLLGGVPSMFKPGERILLKPNLLSRAVPERAVTTHPSVFKAVATVLLEYGVRLTYGDSPAVTSLEKAAGKCGIKAVAGELGIPKADFETAHEVQAPEGALIRRFNIASGVLDADGIVSLPKMKTHAFTTITGAVKNQFGCIPGLLKAEFHARLPDPEDFSRMLLDLTRLINPRLFIMDAVVAMEGNGPGSGTPRVMNLLLFSCDAVAMDTVVARLMGLRPESVPAVAVAMDRGEHTFKTVRTTGDPLDAFVLSGFDVPRVSVKGEGSFLVKLLRNHLIPRPVIDKHACSGCGQCIHICPVTPKALERNDPASPPRHLYAQCIRCYCCQEICPENAINIHIPLLGRLIHKK